MLKKTEIRKAAAQKTPTQGSTAKEATATKTTNKTAATKNTPARKAPTAQFTAEQIYSMTEQAAYFAAHNDGFRKDSTAYWMQAEAEIHNMLVKS